MTVIEQLQKLKDKKIRTLAIHNMIVQNKVYQWDDLYIEVDYIYNALDTFYWDKTEQGITFWSKIYGDIKANK
jgi:hypothetical protein